MTRVQRQAQEQATELARRVPWQVLVATRSQYLDWQEFYYWARPIMESADGIPEWLGQKLNEMCPGFLAAEKEGQRSAQKIVAWRLGDWGNGLIHTSLRSQSAVDGSLQ